MEDYSNEKERSLLCSLLNTPEKIDEVSLIPSDFYGTAHQDIFRTILELNADSDSAVDEDFIKGKLGKNFPEMEMLHVLGANPASNITPYITSIKELSIKRASEQALIQGRTKLVEGANLSEVIHFLDEVSKQHIDSNNQISIQSIMADDTLDAKVIHYDTSSQAFNEVTGGITYPFFYLINGARSSGKSALSIQIVKDFKSLFISLEMSKKMIKQRFTVSGVPKDMTLDFDSYDIVDIERSIRAAHRNGIKIVLIDSLMKIKHREQSSKSRREQLEDISDRIAYIKNKLDISIILIVQSSKDEQGKLSVKGAGDVDYEADIIVQLEQLNNGLTEFWCTKNRANGHEGKATTKFDVESISFSRPDGYYDNGQVLPVTRIREDKIAWKK